MKAIFALTFLLASNLFCWSQETSHVTVYEWEEVMHANPDTIYGLSLSKMKLAELPARLAEFKNLVILDLEKNKLTKLPEFITDFDQLRELNLSRNWFDSFPLPLCRMPNVERLIINRNNFERIPLCIQYMRSLKYLDLYDNPITSLPEELAKLEHLEEIDFSGIRFSETFQEAWKARLPNVNLILDPPCACMEN